jgi:hypothetical protein
MKFFSLIFIYATLSSEVSFASNCESFLGFNWGEVIQQQWLKAQPEFDKKQQKLWGEALGHTLDDLNNDQVNLSGKDQRIKSELIKAVMKLPEIEKAWSSFPESSLKKMYLNSIRQALWAAVTVHTHELIDAKTTDRDFARYFRILSSIQEFNSAKPEFSLYKIKRAIEGRHSISEFIHCK